MLTKLNFKVLVAILFCLFVLAISQVECTDGHCDSARVGSQNRGGVLSNENEETLENSLMLTKRNLIPSVNRRINKQFKRVVANRVSKLGKNTRQDMKKEERIVSQVSVHRVSTKPTKVNSGRNSVKIQTNVLPIKRFIEGVSNSIHKIRSKHAETKPREAPTVIRKQPEPIQNEKRTKLNTPIDSDPSKKLTAKEIVANSIKTFDGSVGPTNSSLANRRPIFKKRIMLRDHDESIRGQEEEPTPADSSCVACRIDCMKEYSTIAGSMFASCELRYYYYGCKYVKPCLKTATSSDDEIEGMIGICAFRNKCKLKNEWALVGMNQLVTDRLVGRIRGSGQDPE